MKFQIIIYTLFTFIVISECGLLSDFIGSVQNEIHNINEGIKKVVVSSVQILHKKRQIIQGEFNELIQDTRNFLNHERRNFDYPPYERSNWYAKNKYTAKPNLNDPRNMNSPEYLSSYSASVLSNAINPTAPRDNDIQMRSGDWRQDSPDRTFGASEGRETVQSPDQIYFPDNRDQFYDQYYRRETDCPYGMIEAPDGSCREAWTRPTRKPNPIGVFEAGCPVGYVRDWTGTCKKF